MKVDVDDAFVGKIGINWLSAVIETTVSSAGGVERMNVVRGEVLVLGNTTDEPTEEVATADFVIEDSELSGIASDVAMAVFAFVSVTASSEGVVEYGSLVTGQVTEKVFGWKVVVVFPFHSSGCILVMLIEVQGLTGRGRPVLTASGTAENSPLVSIAMRVRQLSMPWCRRAPSTISPQANRYYGL